MMVFSVHRHTWTAFDGSMRIDRVGRGQWVETNPFGQFPLQEIGRPIGLATCDGSFCP